MAPEEAGEPEDSGKSGQGGGTDPTRGVDDHSTDRALMLQAEINRLQDQVSREHQILRRVMLLLLLYIVLLAAVIGRTFFGLL